MYKNTLLCVGDEQIINRLKMFETTQSIFIWYKPYMFAFDDNKKKKGFSFL